MGKGVFVSVLLFVSLLAGSFAEGTKQICPTATSEGQLCIDKSRNDFAFFDGASDFRLNIYISNLSERFYFGLGKVTQNDTTKQVHYQVKDPAGNIIIGPLQVPKSGQGFISSYLADTIGPNESAGGYNPITVLPAMTGNYWIEFSYPPDNGTQYSYASYIKFKYFDITVTGATGKPILGRIWSKAWQFNSGVVSPPQGDNQFYGKMFILSDDSIVTSVNCNGFVGGTFSFSSNKTGCSTTGDITVDRQSRQGFHTYPQYKVFLSNPDSTIFPTGKAAPGIALPINVTNHCATGSADFNIKVTQDGVIEVLVEVDPAPGANPRDVRLHANVYANPGGSGYNVVHWNGNDGFGKPLTNGTTIQATIRFIHGITHLPIYDIEFNSLGYIVEVVRPAGPKPDIYWDDSLLEGLSTINLTGCNDASGCHTWDQQTGDTTTVNSWWYVGSTTAPTVSFTILRAPFAPGKILGDSSFCSGGITRTYTIKSEANSTSYMWSYSGTGATISGTDTVATVNFSPESTSGTLSVAGLNQECGSGPPSTLSVIFHPPPQVSLAANDSVCFNEAPFLLNGGTPAGGQYSIDGNVSPVFDPGLAGAGEHQLVYNYTDQYGCSSADTMPVFVRVGHECDILIWVPNAFSPNGDGVNDFFKPVYRNLRQFSMNIFSRNGAIVFSSSNPAKGWDGMFSGNEAPAENYAYIIVYQSSFSPPENTTLTGTVCLVR